MNFRGLYKLAGVCSIGFALVTLAAYAVSVSVQGFVLASVTPPNLDRILLLAQSRGNQIAARLDLLSYFLWIPSLVGLFAFLRERTPGRAHLGGAFAAFGLIGLFAASVMRSAMMEMAQGELTETLKERLTALDSLSFSCTLQALYAFVASNLLWGLALRTQAGLSRFAGDMFLLQVAAFAIANSGFFSSQEVMSSTQGLINALIVAATYASVCLLLVRASKEDVGTKPDIQQKPHAAGASA